MQWTPRGAHLLLQTRTKVLHGDLAETFRGWYPAFRHDAEGLAACPACPRKFTLSKLALRRNSRFFVFCHIRKARFPGAHVYSTVKGSLTGSLWYKSLFRLTW